MPEKPARRPRYPGKNPRRFDEKYKEHQPDRYAEDVARVIASGKTPAGMHRPILMAEVLDSLAPKPGEIAVDCTLGFGGHAQELLRAVQPGGRLLGIDVDPRELPRAEARLLALGYPRESIAVKRSNFAGLIAFLAAEAPGGTDVLLADLGLSSMQIDDPARGFSYKVDGPLDMRMNPGRGPSASEFLSTLDPDRLAQLLADHGDEPRARELAFAILDAHAERPITSTLALAGVVRRTVRSLSRRREAGEDDAVRRVFQAIRIAVNDEFTALESFLRQLPSCLKPGGRVAILSFHSGEDRRVKSAFKAGLDQGLYATISPEVVRASAEERRSNPRSSSAKLRYAVRAASPTP
jgi:16S rRNA (cytosine1402-N4)-methyltransferase